MSTDDGYASYGGLAYENVPIDEADVVIQGIPFDSAASSRKGAKFAPSKIRFLSVDLQTMSRDGIDLESLVVSDMGNIPIFPLNDKKTRDSIKSKSSLILNELKGSLISIGGDHSNTFPLLQSFAEKGKVAVIWFDAHRDLLPELDGSKYSHACPLGRALELGNIHAENILLVGTRYMDQTEQDIVSKNNIAELRMVDIEQSNFDITEFVEKVEMITKNVDYVYVSIDIDVLDPAFAPGTGTPVAGGMTSSQLMRYLRAIPTKVHGFDIMEVSPPYDSSEITQFAVLGILTEIFTHILLNKNN